MQACRTGLTVSSIEPMDQVTNPVWLVTATDDRRFVLKCLPEYPPGVGLVDEVRVVSFLLGKGIPVALPIATDDARLTTTLGDDTYTLLPFLEADTDNHERGPRAAETARAIGAAIGRLDAALADCPWQLDSYVDDPGREMLDTKAPALPEVVTLIAPIADRLRAAVRDLPIQRTRGDCNTGNVLVRDTTVTGILDLAYYLASRLRRHLDGPAGQEAADAMVAVLGDYVGGYRDAYELTDDEVVAVVPLMLLCEIGSANWSVHGWVPDPQGYDRAVAAIRWLVERLDALTATATG